VSDQLNRKQALAVAHYAGFRAERLVTAVAVMGAESVAFLAAPGPGRGSSDSSAP
jgi:hypothetical protein